MTSNREPASADTGKAEAEFEAGVLTVTFLKVAEAKPRQIEVKKKYSPVYQIGRDVTQSTGPVQNDAIPRRTAMSLIDSLLATLPDGPVREVQVGAFWTAVVVETEGRLRCGLAATLRNDDHHWGGGPAIRDAGFLMERNARELAELARSESPMEAAIGMAAINALLPAHAELWADLNAEEVIAERGAGRRVALVGHFPFIPRLRERVGTLWVLEQQPRGEDLPADAASEVIPRADVVAITGTTLINHTFERLMALCRPEALVLVLGPSTPLSPVLFDHGVRILSGSVVDDVEAVLRAVRQGAYFRQVRRQGVRLVTMDRSSLNP
ncbi:MAG: Rossmann-like domain-containing protein [Anaerolineae bacterium]